MPLAATVHQDLVARSPELGADENRMTAAGAWQATMNQTGRIGSIATDDLKAQAAMSTGHTLKVPAFTNKSVTVRSTRPLVIPDSENDSVFYTVTWNTFALGFTMLPTRHHNNYISYVDDFGQKYKIVAQALVDAIETAATTNIDAGKTLVLPSVTGDNLAFNTDIVNETGLTSVKESYVLSQLDPLMRINDFNSPVLDVVGNHGLMGALNMMEGFGQMNQENKMIQWQGKNFTFTNKVADALNKRFTGYAIADNTIAYLSRVELDSLYGSSLPDGHLWGTMFMPELGIEVGTYYYPSAVDASAVDASTGHLTRTVKEAYDFAVDIAFIRKYNSDTATIPTGIIKFDGQTA